MSNSIMKVSVDAQKAMNASTELASVLVPVGLTQNVKEMVDVYQTARRKDPQYIHALSNAMNTAISSEAFSDFVTDKAQQAVYFAHFDELIAAFRSELALPKDLVKSLLDTYADIADLQEKGYDCDVIDSEEFEEFQSEFYDRLRQLLEHEMESLMEA